MAKEILKCVKCSNYTLEREHCDEKTITIKPAKFSLDDKWFKWRIKAKKNEMEH